MSKFSPDNVVSLIDYASVVFIGFAVISGIWYLISTTFLLNAHNTYNTWRLDGRQHYSGPPISGENWTQKGRGVEKEY